MKKTYTAPALHSVELSLEGQLLDGSNTLNMSDDTSGDTGKASNALSASTIWGDFSDSIWDND